MADVRGGVFAALFGVLAVSGCAESPSEPASSSAATTAPPPTVDAATGSISGLVVDDEAAPIATARVGLVETTATAQTDAGGRFTFNELQPGTYSVLAERLGFESAARKIEVKGGEVAKVTITLKPLAIADEAYVLAIPKNTIIHFDAEGGSDVSRNVNHSAIHGLRCDPCKVYLHIDRDPSAVLTEVRWSPAGTTGLNQYAGLLYEKSWDDTTTPPTLTSVCRADARTNPYSLPWSEACVSATKKTDVLRIRFRGGGTGAVSFEQKVESWTTFGYNGDLPEDYSAFPKP